MEPKWQFLRGLRNSIRRPVNRDDGPISPGNALIRVSDIGATSKLNATGTDPMANANAPRTTPAWATTAIRPRSFRDPDQRRCDTRAKVGKALAPRRAVRCQFIRPKGSEIGQVAIVLPFPRTEILLPKRGIRLWLWQTGPQCGGRLTAPCSRAGQNMIYIADRVFQCGDRAVSLQSAPTSVRPQSRPALSAGACRINSSSVAA